MSGPYDEEHAQDSRRSEQNDSARTSSWIGGCPSPLRLCDRAIAPISVVTVLASLGTGIGVTYVYSHRRSEHDKIGPNRATILENEQTLANQTSYIGSQNEEIEGLLAQLNRCRDGGGGTDLDSRDVLSTLGATEEGSVLIIVEATPSAESTAATASETGK